MLGGGHGFLQAKYGLLADQLLEARVVLANGTVVTVSNSSHADLFWAIRGAGHNFGIVTEFEYKIYDVLADNMWTYEAFIFPGDKLEALYEVTEVMMKNQPPEVVNYAIFLLLPEIDPIHVCPHLCLEVYPYLTANLACNSLLCPLQRSCRSCADVHQADPRVGPNQRPSRRSAIHAAS